MYFVKFRNNTFHECCLAILDQLHAKHCHINCSILKTFCTALSRVLFELKFCIKYGEVTRMRVEEIPLNPLGDYIVKELRTFAVGCGGLLVTGKTLDCIATR